jgi:hypothetical protein
MVNNILKIYLKIFLFFEVFSNTSRSIKNLITLEIIIMQKKDKLLKYNLNSNSKKKKKKIFISFI